MSAMDRRRPLALQQLLELLQAVVLLQVLSMLSRPWSYYGNMCGPDCPCKVARDRWHRSGVLAQGRLQPVSHRFDQVQMKVHQIAVLLWV